MKTYKRTTTCDTSVEVYELTSLDIKEKKRNYVDVATLLRLLFQFCEKDGNRWHNSNGLPKILFDFNTE